MLKPYFKPINGFHIFAIAGVAFLAILPAFVYGVFDAHDLANFHLFWAKEFSDQFWSGEWYPRWLLNMNAGLGCPTFFFYAPVPYYFTSLLRPLVFTPDPLGWDQLCLASYVGLAASGMTAYVWLKSLTSPRAALIGSLVYLIAPYHLAIDFYARFTYGEFWSFVWFPLLLYFCQKLIEGRKVAVIGLAIAQALLIMTHLPSFLVFFPVPLLYILWNPTGHTTQKPRIQTLIGFGLAVIVAVGLAAIYWFPAMTTQDYVSLKPTGEFIETAFFGNNYLFVVHPAGRASFWIYLEVSAILTLAFSICTFLVARRHPEIHSQRQSKFWVAIAIASFLMQVPISYPVWLILPPLQKIELPWRFGLVSTVAMIALVALASLSLQPVQIWHRKTLSSAIAFLGFGTLLAVMALVPMVMVQIFQNDESSLWNLVPVKLLWMLVVIGAAIALAQLRVPALLPNHRVFAIGLLLGIALLVTSAAPIKRYLAPSPDLEAQLNVQLDAYAHRPQWVPEQLYTHERLPEIVRDRFGSAYTAEARDRVEIQQWKPRNLVLQSNSPTDRWLTLKQFYYPGWTARLTNTSASLEVRPSAEGLLQVKIPSGKHQTRLVLEPLSQEQIGQWISAIFSVLTMLLLVWFRWRNVASTQARRRYSDSI
jgi:hypothetical protein